MAYAPPGVLVPPPGIPTPSSRGSVGSAFGTSPASAYESFRPLSAIGPPPKGLPNTPGSPISMFSSGPGSVPGGGGSSSTNHHLRRGSVQDRSMTMSMSNTYGAVQRPVAPLAPIARPQQNSKDDEKSSSLASGSGSGPGSTAGGMLISSPKMMMKSSSSTPAPSSAPPEPVLGSSALVADDDEPIIVQPRRVIAPVGWGTPQPASAVAVAGGQSLPFGTPTRTPNGLWGPGHGPSAVDPWQQPGPPFSAHPPFPPPAAFTNSPPPGSS